MSQRIYVRNGEIKIQKKKNQVLNKKSVTLSNKAGVLEGDIKHIQVFMKCDGFAFGRVRRMRCIGYIALFRIMVTEVLME